MQRSQKVFLKREKIIDSGISITECLTACRMEERNKASNKHGFRNLLTKDGKILFNQNGASQKK